MKRDDIQLTNSKVQSKRAIYLKNCWYVAGFDDDVGRSLLERTILNQLVVLYRRNDGTPVGMEGRCAHRRLPLSMGKLIGDTVECAYHGVTYDSGGRCIKIPGQSHIPQGTCVRSFPVVERHRYVWIWMGDAALADPALIPDFRQLDDRSLMVTRRHIHLQCYYQLHIDNLLDLSHIGYVHQATTGNTSVVEGGTVKTEFDENTVWVKRWQKNIPPSPLFAQFGGYGENSRVDMWQITEYRPPSYMRLSYGSSPAGDRVPEDIWDHGRWGFRVVQSTTPETDRSAHQFTNIIFDPAMGDPAAVPALRDMLDQVIREDIPVLAAQERSIDSDPEASPLNVRSGLTTEADAGLNQARKILMRRHDEEQKRTGQTVPA